MTLFFLFTLVVKNNSFFSVMDELGVALKSIDGWKDSGNGMDVVGFSVLPVEYEYIPSYPAHYEFRMERSASFWALNEKVVFSYSRGSFFYI